MRELLNKIFREIPKGGPQNPSGQTLPLEEWYPVGAREKREQEKRRKQRKQPLRVRISPPYTGSRREEYFVKTLKTASERPVHRRKRRLWLQKQERSTLQ